MEPKDSVLRSAGSALDRRDLDRTVDDFSAPRSSAPAYSLIVMNGPTAGATIRLEDAATEVTIGRHTSRDIVIDDDCASRLHARVFFRAGHWLIEDCGSRNGTSVNSQPVQQSVIEPGDLVRIGERLIMVVDTAPGENCESYGLGFRPTTLAGHGAVGDPRRALVEQSVSESMSRVVRDSEVLCRLVNLLHQHRDVAPLVQSATGALVDAIHPDAIAVWIVAADGRLKCAGRWGETLHEQVLARLAVEKRKAILIDDPRSDIGNSPDDLGAGVGTAMAVPIPEQKGIRGAIECQRRRDRQPFTRSDLDLAVVVAHQLGMALENLEHRERLESANDELRRRLESQTRLVGTSPAMQSVLDKIGRVGPTDSTVLILGESGSGKELVAAAIHELSRHSAGPYAAVNCAAFPESLLESELFGHEAGAFTGADRRHIGQFERAHRGTIFLDEVGEMSLACQAKLLRMLEGQPFQRVGGTEAIHADTRLIAATNRDLPELVREKKFREDLFYRLRVIDIHLPPLRERGDDVIELAGLFLEQVRTKTGRSPRRFTTAAMSSLRLHRWPGNVRELKNTIERAMVFCKSDEIDVADLGLPRAIADDEPADRLLTLDQAERRHILYVLREVGGNKTQACKILDISRATLYAKLGEKEV